MYINTVHDERDQNINEIEKFQQLKELLKFDETDVIFKHKGKQYAVASMREDVSKSIYPTTTHSEGILFGLWEIQDGKRIPVGWCEATKKEGKEDITVGSSHIEKYPKKGKFHDLINIQTTEEENHAFIIDKVAFVLDKNYRKTALADVFLAECLVAFEAMGEQNVTFESDQTVVEEDSPKFIPQFNSSNGLIQETTEGSFYTKYGGTRELELNKKGNRYYNTKISTKITGYQESLLNEVFKS